MKKTVLFLLVVSLLFGLSSCGFLLETGESSAESAEESESYFEGFENIFADSEDEQSEQRFETDESEPGHTSFAESENSDESESKHDEESRESQEPMVWIPKSGSKYHSKAGCSNMKNPTQVTKSEAEAMGYTPCKRCH